MDLLSLPSILLTLILGASAGLLAGLLGIGGGVILVPLFLWLFPLAGFPPELAVHSAFGTSLAIILPTSISSTLGHRKRGNVDWRMVLYLAVGGVFGAFSGATLAALIHGNSLKTAFGLMQILVSVKLLCYREPATLPDGHSAHGTVSGLLLIGLVGGFFSAFFGIGGGVVAVPLMLLILRLPIHLAVGNSSALIVISSFTAVIGYVAHGLQHSPSMPFSIGYVNFLVALLVAPLTMIFARFGVKLSSRISQKRLVRIFAVLLLLIGVKIVFNL